MTSATQEGHKRSLVKAISWRALGSLDTLLLSYLVTGSLKAAGSIATVETFTKVGLYYLHERAWAVFPGGPPKNAIRASLTTRARLALALMMSKLPQAPLLQPSKLAIVGAFLICFSVTFAGPFQALDSGHLREAAQDTEVRAQIATIAAPPVEPVSDPARPVQQASLPTNPEPQSPAVTLAAAPSTTQEEQGREHKYDELAQAVHPPRRPDEITGAITAPRPSFVGTWATRAGACSSQSGQFLPAVIDDHGARAGRTTCQFKQKRQDEVGWNVVAQCSDGRERWTARVRLRAEANRLVWISERGTQAYIRCGQQLRVADVR